MKKQQLTMEQEQKIMDFQMHFNNFDWNESNGETFVGLMREALDAGGFDFESIDSIDRFLNDIIEPQWKKLQSRESELTELVKDEFRKAGATEVQLTWGMLENVRLTRQAERRIERIGKKLDKLRMEALPLMGLAAALNEARAKLTA